MAEAAKQEGSASIAGDALSINEDDLTLDEIDDIESVTGRIMAKILSDLAHCAICDQIHRPAPKPLPEIGAKGKRVRPAPKPEYDHPMFPRLNAKEMAALIWIQERRTNPDFTFEQARGYTVGQIFSPAQRVPKG